MRRPAIVFPETLEAAIEALDARGAIPLAGATDLIPAMRRGELTPRRLVDLKRIPQLRGIRRSRAGVRIGAAVPVADLLSDPVIAREAPLLAETARQFGAPQIRTLATVGGNLCNAAPSADLALPLLVLDARVEIRGPDGRRTLDLCEFFRGVNRTALSRGEIVTAVIVPRRRARQGAAHIKLGIRRAMDLAVVGVAAAVELQRGDACRRVRIALGAVAPRPMRATRAEAVLEGRVVTEAVIDAAAEAAANQCRPISDVRGSAEYRRDMVRTLTARALREAVRRAAKEGE